MYWWKCLKVISVGWNQSESMNNNNKKKQISSRFSTNKGNRQAIDLQYYFSSKKRHKHISMDLFILILLCLPFILVLWDRMDQTHNFFLFFLFFWFKSFWFKRKHKICQMSLVYCTMRKFWIEWELNATAIKAQMEDWTVF